MSDTAVIDLTLLDHDITGDIPCDRTGLPKDSHETLGSGPATWWVIQVPRLDCGCPGVTLAYCDGCKEYALKHQGPGIVCARCMKHIDGPMRQCIARVEAIR